MNSTSKNDPINIMQYYWFCNFRCLCPPLRGGKTCEIEKTNACLPNPCLNGGSCQNAKKDGFYCLCRAGYQGIFFRHFPIIYIFLKVDSSHKIFPVKQQVLNFFGKPKIVVIKQISLVELPSTFTAFSSIALFPL